MRTVPWRSLILILAALLAIRLLPRAVRKEAQVIALVRELLALVSAAQLVNSSKGYSTEQRVAAVEASRLRKSGGTITGDLAVNGTMAAGGASSGASIAGTDLHCSSTGSFDAGLIINGYTIVDSSKNIRGPYVHISGDGVFDGDVSGTTVNGGTVDPTQVSYGHMADISSPTEITVAWCNGAAHRINQLLSAFGHTT